MAYGETKTTDGGRGKRRWLRVFLMVAGLVVLVGSGLFFLRDGTARAEAADADSQAAEAEESGDEAEEKAAIPVRVARIGTGTVSDYISATANLVAENQVLVLAEAEGRVARLLVDENDRVERGQVLATLVKDDEEIAFRKAELNYENARLAFQRIEDLAAKELISREEFDNAKRDFEIAEQELAEARWKLDKATIRSPFAGQISERMIQVGQHMQVGDELFQITDTDPLVARIYLPEKDVIGLDNSRPVRISLNADPDVKFDAAIRHISPVVDTETGTVKVTIEASSVPSKVRSGSFVTVDIVRNQRAGAVLLPREAVVRELKKAHVFVASDETAVRREVELGLEESEFVEVLSGVEAGEEVVVAGQGGLKEGAAIKVLETAEEAAQG